MITDIIGLIVILTILTMPITGFIIARWGFEEADHYGSESLR